MKTFRFLLFSVLVITACGKPEPAKEKIEEEEETTTPAIILERSSTGHPKLDIMIDSLFAAFKDSSTTAFAKISPSEKEIVAMYLQMAPPEYDKDMIRQKLKEEGTAAMEVKMINSGFDLALKRGNEQGINWKGIQLTSSSIDSVLENGVMLYKGEIGFTENEREFNMKFSDVMLVGKRMALTSIAIPLEDKSDVNVAWNKKYKKSYMRRCIESEKKRPSVGRKGLSPEDYCLCSFTNIAKQEYGEGNLKDTVHLTTDSRNCH